MEYSPEWLEVVRRAIDLGRRTGRKRSVFAVESASAARGWHWVTLPVPDLPVGGKRG
jgi:hypothetical protein